MICTFTVSAEMEEFSEPSDSRGGSVVDLLPAVGYLFNFALVAFTSLFITYKWLHTLPGQFLSSLHILYWVCAFFIVCLSSDAACHCPPHGNDSSEEQTALGSVKRSGIFPLSNFRDSF
jgi:hypothetical protein